MQFNIDKKKLLYGAGIGSLAALSSLGSNELENHYNETANESLKNFKDSIKTGTFRLKVPNISYSTDPVTHKELLSIGDYNTSGDELQKAINNRDLDKLKELKDHNINLFLNNKNVFDEVNNYKHAELLKNAAGISKYALPAGIIGTGPAGYKYLSNKLKNGK